MPELSTQMHARYGVRPRSRWAVAAVAMLAVAFTGFVVWTGWRLATPPVQAKLLAFQIESAELVTVVFEVRRDTLTDTVCVLRAQDLDRTDVGYATVTITRGRDYVQPRFPLATRDRATIAEVLGCAPSEAPIVEAPQFPPGTTNPPQVEVIDGS